MSRTARAKAEFNHDWLGIQCPNRATDWIPESQTIELERGDNLAATNA
jgi:hypothetical protein